LVKRLNVALDIPVKSCLTLSLRLICCTINNLRDKIPVFLSELLGFLKYNLKGCCSHSIRLFLITRDCVPSLLYIEVWKSLKRHLIQRGYKQEEALRKTHLHVKTPYSDRIDGYKHEEAQRKTSFHVKTPYPDKIAVINLKRYKGWNPFRETTANRVTNLEKLQQSPAFFKVEDPPSFQDIHNHNWVNPEIYAL